ncbi:MAG TPA: NADH-quinone oxidoreductase subunit I [Bacteroidales bacterium]|nr:NADH-quinone oxidoreductase subunit I [Bacteroidales bacterium]
MQYFSDVFHAVKSLLTGMRVTGYYFFHHKEIVTQEYPENRATLKMFERFKGEVLMPHTESNEHKCTGCGICEMNCPNGSIEILTTFETVDGKKKKIIDKHIYHLSMCTFCGLCVKTCPSDALAFGNDFEHAVFDRQSLTKVLNKPGSTLNKEVKE